MFGESHEGWTASFQEPLVRRTSGTLCLLSCLLMTAPMSCTLFSGVATPETAVGITMKLSSGCLTIFTLQYVMRSFPLCGVRVLHPAQYDLSITIMVTAKKEEKNGTPWLSSSRKQRLACFPASLPTNANPNIRVLFYSIDSNRGQIFRYVFKGEWSM